MRGLSGPVVLIAVVATMSAPLSAQWPSYPYRNVPRTPDGKIFTDGRPLPANDPQPFWYGYSVGRWEGETLVVETRGFRDGEWLDINGSPLTEAGRTIERFRRVNVGQLDIEITIDDPKAYTRPFTVKLRQRLMPDTEIIEMVCLENNLSIEHIEPPK